GILSGHERGAKRNAVLMNAGAGLYIAGKAASIQEGINLAEKLIDTGKALDTLDKFITISNE
ncbi:MAG: anthranilate phosphoribosyltransferase, partial [Synergistaceae bacterium]|nr:anthranilate phosphoribosyltransferase [Synergistaceae bacterium]